MWYPFPLIVILGVDCERADRSADEASDGDGEEDRVENPQREDEENEEQQNGNETLSLFLNIPSEQSLKSSFIVVTSTEFVSNIQVSTPHKH